MEYKVTPDIREKEKIVGGKFTWTQTVFIALALVCGLGLGFLAYTSTESLVLTLLGFVIGAAPFLPFAIITVEKMGKMELAKYLFIKFKFQRKQKTFLNINENMRDHLRENDND